MKNLLRTLMVLLITVHLAWDISTSPDVTGYKLYYGTASRTYGNPVNVGNVTEYVLTNIDETQPMFFAVTAYNSLLNESAYSVELEAIAINSVINGSFPLKIPIAFERNKTVSRTIPPMGIAEDTAAITLTDMVDADHVVTAFKHGNTWIDHPPTVVTLSNLSNAQDVTIVIQKKATLTGMDY